MPTDRVELLASLEKHNAAFSTLLSLIPSQYYIAPTQEEEDMREAEIQADSKWMKNKKRKTGEEIKEHKRRAKVSKLDPENNKTTDQLLSAPSPDASSSSALPLPPAASTSTGLTPLPPAASIASLKAKLAAKLAGFRQNRGLPAPNADGEGEDGEPLSRDALEAERRAKRGELRDKRRAKKKEERRKHVDVEKAKAKGKSKEDVSVKPGKTHLLVPHLPSGDNISFPIPSLPSSGQAGPSGTQKAPLKNLSNPAQALAHLQKHQSKLASLPEDKRAEVVEMERWAKAEERAAGGKVADSERTLKKAVKRLEKTKAKSGKEWADRKKQLDKVQHAAIKKRSTNIQARAEEKRNKRLGIKDKSKDKPKDRKGGGKKGRPGFEGKKGGNAKGAKGGKGKPGMTGGSKGGKGR